MSDSEFQPSTRCGCGPNVVPEAPRAPVPHVFEQGRHAFTAAEGLDIRKAVDKARENVRYLTALSLECQTALRLNEEFDKKHAPLLHSPNRLPDEVWTEVFKIASAHPIKPNASPHRFRSATPSTAPLSLSHVNSKWRSVALWTASIWSKIDIFIQDTSFPSSKLNLLNMYLARSSMHCLDVELEMVDDTDDCYVSWGHFPDRDKKTIVQALEILITQSGRWRSAVLKLPSDVFSSYLFPIHSAPKLESLAIHTCNWVMDGERWRPIFLTESPNLESFEFGNFFVPRDSIRSMLSWATLKTIRNPRIINRIGGWGFSIDDALEVMRTSLHLKTLHFAIGKEGPPSTPSLQHNNLEFLRLLCRSSSILSLLTTPALADLQLHLMRVTSPGDVANFLSTERSPSLRRLMLCDCDLDIVRQLLSLSVIYITDLQIIFKTFCDQDIEVLQSLSEDGWINLARLQSLTLRLRYTDIPSEKLVQSVRLSGAIAKIAERFQAEARSEKSLRQLTLRVKPSGIPDVALETFNYLKQLHCDGLRVVFDSH